MDAAEAERALRRAQTREWLRHELRTALCVVVGREQLLHKRVRRGEPPERLTADFEALEAALLRVTAAVGASPAARARRGSALPHCRRCGSARVRPPAPGAASPATSRPSPLRSPPF